MWFRTQYHLPSEEKTNGVRKRGGCDSKHDITYILRKKKMEFIGMDGVIEIESTISLTR